MTLKTTERQSILRSVWIRAHEEGKAVFSLQTPAQAKYMRASLYALARKARKKAGDIELLQAISTCSISVQETELVVYKNTLHEGIQQLNSTLTDAKGNESFQLMIKQLQKEDKEETININPYYKRESI